MKTVTVNFRTLPEVNDRINAHVEKTGMRKERWLEKVIEEALDRAEQTAKKERTPHGTKYP